MIMIPYIVLLVQHFLIQRVPLRCVFDSTQMRGSCDPAIRWLLLDVTPVSPPLPNMAPAPEAIPCAAAAADKDLFLIKNRLLDHQIMFIFDILVNFGYIHIVSFWDIN